MSEFPYPWSESIWRQTRAAHRRLPHGILLSGSSGTGKLEFGFALARAELCDQSFASGDESAGCGSCRSCQLFDAGAHPDFHFLATESIVENLDETKRACASRHLPERPKSRKVASRLIAVDRIRTLNETLALRAFGERKFTLIAPADGMNIQAANALLKLLEEPPSNTRLVLLSSRIFRLPATIRSRTSRIDCVSPPLKAGVAWLAAGGVDAGAAKKLLLTTGAGPVHALALHRQGFTQVLDDLEASVVAVVDGQKSVSETATAWAKRAKDGVSAEDVVPMLRSVLDELARRHQIEARSNNDELQALVPRLHLKRLHEAALSLTRLASVWDSVLDNTLLLEQAFTVVRSVRN